MIISEFNKRYEITELGLINLSVSPILCISGLAEVYLKALYSIKENIRLQGKEVIIPKVRTEYLGTLEFNELEQFVSSNEEVLVQIKKDAIKKSLSLPHTKVCGLLDFRMLRKGQLFTNVSSLKAGVYFSDITR